VTAEQKTVRFADENAQRGFTQIPNGILFDPDLSPSAVRLWAALASFAWRDESVWPGQERLAEMIGLSDRTVRTLCAELRSAGLLESKRRGLGRTNVYVLFGAEVGFRSERKSASDEVDEEKKTKTPSSPSASKRRPDPVWDALVAVCGAPATKSETTDFAKTVSEIRPLIPSTADCATITVAIDARRREFIRRYPTATFTHRVLRNRWNELRPVLGSGAAGPAYRELGEDES
jgi:hypothetical protein